MRGDKERSRTEVGDVARGIGSYGDESQQAEDRQNEGTVVLQSEVVIQVEEFKYLGSIVQADGGSERGCKTDKGSMGRMEK